MEYRTRERAYKCLLMQGGYVEPDDPAISFRKAYVVGREIYLTEDAAEKATRETRPMGNIEVVTYYEAYLHAYPYYTKNN